MQEVVDKEVLYIHLMFLSEQVMHEGDYSGLSQTIPPVSRKVRAKVKELTVLSRHQHGEGSQ